MTFNRNIYATKKTIAIGILDIALMICHVCMFFHTTQIGTGHELYSPLLSLLTIMLFLQVCLAILVIFLGCSNVNEETHHVRLQFLNNFITVFVIVIAILNLIAITFALEISKDREPGVTDYVAEAS